MLSAAAHPVLCTAEVAPTPVFPCPGLLCSAARVFPALQAMVSFCKSQPVPLGPFLLCLHLQPRCSPGHAASPEPHEGAPSPWAELASSRPFSCPCSQMLALEAAGRCR